MCWSQPVVRFPSSKPRQSYRGRSRSFSLWAATRSNSGLSQASIGRGDNITGVAFLVNGLASKQMELLHSLLPTTGVIGFLINPKDPNAETDSKDAQTAASLLGLKLVVGAASSESEIETSLASFVQQHVGALFVDAEP